MENAPPPEAAPPAEAGDAVAAYAAPADVPPAPATVEAPLPDAPSSEAQAAAEPALEPPQQEEAPTADAAPPLPTASPPPPPPITSSSEPRFPLARCRWCTSPALTPENSIRKRYDGDALTVNGIRLLSVLGEGSYAEVLLGEDKRLLPEGGVVGGPGKPVAVKVYSQSRLAKVKNFDRGAGGRLRVTTALDKVHDEVRLMRVLCGGPVTLGGVSYSAHPQILQLRRVLMDPEADEIYCSFDFAEAGTSMTYVPAASSNDDATLPVPGELAVGSGGIAAGRFVCKALGDTPRVFTLDEARSLMRDLVAALKHAHGLGIAHRDLKPDNLLLTATGRLVVGDWGVAKLFPLPPPPSHHAHVPGVSDAAIAVLRPRSAAAASATEGSSGSEDTISYLARAYVDAGYGLLQDTAGTLLFLPPECVGSSEGSSNGSSNSEGGAGSSSSDVPPPPPPPGPPSGPPRMVGRKGPPAPPVALPSPQEPASSPTSSDTPKGGHDAFLADIWSAGVCLFIFLFGRPPFGRGAATAFELFDAISAGSLLPLPVNEAVDPAAVAADPHLADLLAGMLAKDPAQRLRLKDVEAHPWLASGSSGGGVAVKPIDVAALPPYRRTPPPPAGRRASKMQLQLPVEALAASTASLPSSAAGAETLASGGSSEGGAAAAVAAPAPASAQAAPCSGWLRKRGTSFPHLWRQRWFVLDAASKQLLMSKKAPVSPSSATPGDATPKKQGWLRSLFRPSSASSSSSPTAPPANEGGAPVLSLAPGFRMLAPPGTLQLHLSDAEGRKLLLIAPSAEAHTTWVAAFGALVTE